MNEVKTVANPSNASVPGNRENAAMFNEIAETYDFLNHLLSLNTDKKWRRKAIRILTSGNPERILDVATGTADMAIGAANESDAQVTGVDVSQGMLEIGQKKINKLGFQDRIMLVKSPCENLPFENNSFDAAIVAFGVRNFQDPDKGLGEIFRVLKCDAKLVVLEFTLPANPILRWGYRFYFHNIVPLIGKWFSKDLSAYRYLPDSVEAFPKGPAFVAMVNKAGFSESAYFPLSYGICGLYTATKKNFSNTI